MYNNTNIDFINVFKFYDLISDEDVLKFAKDMEILFNKNENFYIILDVMQIKNFNFDFFNKFDHIFEDEYKVKKYFKGSVILTNNKRILSFILSIKKPLMPTNVNNNYEDAIKYIKDLKNI